MKALSLWQPWGQCIALGAKGIETRSWETSYRGPLAIHAAKKAIPSLYRQQVEASLRRFGGGRFALPERLPLGAVVAVADLVDVVLVDSPEGQRLVLSLTPLELDLGGYGPGRYAWVLENVRALDPVPASGRQGVWEWAEPTELVA